MKQDQIEKTVNPNKTNSSLRVRSTVHFKGTANRSGSEPRFYTHHINGYLQEADKLIKKLKKELPNSSKGVRLDLGAQIEDVKRKRVELQLKLEKAWRNNRKTWAIFKMEFEKENKTLVKGYDQLLKRIKGITD